jgi:hypothetical protein
LTALYIESLYRQRYNLFTQPTSSKVDHERYVCDKLYERLAQPVAAAFKTFTSWDCYLEAWRALHLISRDWPTLSTLTEDAIRMSQDQAAWQVALQLDHDMPSLVDLAIENCTALARTFLSKTIARQYETRQIIDRIIASRNVDTIPVLMDLDLTSHFDLAHPAEAEFISRVWEQSARPVALGPFSAHHQGTALCAVLRIHILNGQPLEGDESLLPGLTSWSDDLAALLVSQDRAMLTRSATIPDAPIATSLMLSSPASSTSSQISCYIAGSEFNDSVQLMTGLLSMLQNARN